MSMSSRAE